MAASKKNENQTENLPQTATNEVPAYMQKFMQQSQVDANSMAASSQSVPRLSFRGKRFRFINNGDEELIKDISVDVVILGVEPEAGRNIKTYYEKAYNPGDSEPPTCSSSNGVTPDAWVSDPQAEYCGKCPKNIFGSATSRSGGKAKACKDGKRLWVAKPEDLSVVYGLGVPVTSLKALSEYGKYIAKNQYPLALVITTLGMDDDAEFPELTFTHKGFIKEALVEEATAINMDRPWRTDYSSTPILPEHSSASKTTPQPQAQPTPVSNASVEDAVGSW